MRLRVERKYLKDKYTIGDLYIDYEDGAGWVFFCNTLEDKVRDFNKDGDLLDEGEGKVEKETAIPYGTYDLEISCSPKFKRKMPRILNVKHFDGILIHSGTTAENSWGCILVGKNNEVGKLNNSILIFEKLMYVFKNNKQSIYKIEII